MTFTAHAGFDFDRIGMLEYSFQESLGGVAKTVQISTGTHCHIDLSGVMGASEYTDLASLLDATMTSLSPNGLAYGVAFSETTLQYLFVPSSGQIRFNSMNTLAQQVLGFSSVPAVYADSLTSDRGAYYSVIASPEGLARTKDRQHEPDDIAEDAEAGSTTWYGIVDADVPQYRDFRLHYCLAERVRAGDADASFPWTFEHFWKHVRNTEPFAIKDDEASQVHALLANGAHWAPEEWITNHKDRFNLRFRTRVLGDL